MALLSECSKAVKYHGVPVSLIADWIREMKGPVVVIGSGWGSLVAILIHVFGLDRECFVLVDPAPGSCGERPSDPAEIIAPDYKTVCDLFLACPRIVGCCDVMLPWPFPGSNYGHYDIHSVKMLAPKNVIAIYERGLDAGTYGLHYWFETIGVDTSMRAYNVKWETDFPEANYVEKRHYHTINRDDSDGKKIETCNIATWLIREDTA